MMNPKLKIGLIAGGSIAVLVVAYLVYKKMKAAKKEEAVSIQGSIPVNMTGSIPTGLDYSELEKRTDKLKVNSTDSANTKYAKFLIYNVGNGYMSVTEAKDEISKITELKSIIKSIYYAAPNDFNAAQKSLIN